MSRDWLITRMGAIALNRVEEFKLVVGPDSVDILAVMLGGREVMVERLRLDPEEAKHVPLLIENRQALIEKGIKYLAGVLPNCSAKR